MTVLAPDCMLQSKLMH